MSESASPECKICAADIPAAYEIYSDTLWRVRHSSETNILGYCIVEPRRHFLDLSEATAAELAAYGPVLADIMRIQRDLLKCERIYTFSLAEAVHHFHVHLIPRSKTFPRAYVGRGIMSYPTSPAADPSLVGHMVTLLKSRLRRSSSYYSD